MDDNAVPNRVGLVVLSQALDFSVGSQTDLRGASYEAFLSMILMILVFGTSIIVLNVMIIYIIILFDEFVLLPVQADSDRRHE